MRVQLAQLVETPSPARPPEEELDPLRVNEVLVETDLVAVRTDLSRSLVALLFDLRPGLRGWDSNVGLLVAWQVREANVRLATADRGPRGWLANPVGYSHVSQEDGDWALELGLVFGGGISLRARHARFHTGDVDFGDNQYRQPDFGLDSDEAVRGSMPAWHSTLELLATSSIEIR